MARFYPKGGMCCNCTRADLDCSKLDFSAMPVIREDGDGCKCVRCTEYRRPSGRIGE